MKYKSLFFISVLINLSLVAAYVFKPSRVVEVPMLVASTLSEPLSRSVSMTNIIAAPPVTKLLGWRAVESDDYKKYIANLRAIGCPEKTIRDIIVADVNDLFRQRFREAFPPTNNVEYWRPGNPLANLVDETHITKLQELAREKRELIKALLGSDYGSEMDMSAIQMENFTERLLNFLTPEKRDAMKELEQKFTVKMMKTMKDSVRGDNDGKQALQVEKDMEMLKVLSPEEKFEYDLRRSETSMFIRVGLRDFELTEQEFRHVFEPLKKFMEVVGPAGYGAMIRGEEDPREKALAARKSLESAFNSTLGKERFRALTEQTGWGLETE